MSKRVRHHGVTEDLGSHFMLLTSTQHRGLAKLLRQKAAKLAVYAVAVVGDAGSPKRTRHMKGRKSESRYGGDRWPKRR